MNALTNKTSSQAFFLRVLKVIIQLREAALNAIKKSRQAKNAKEVAAAVQEEQLERQQQQQQQPTETETAAAAAATVETEVVPAEGEAASATPTPVSETAATPMDVEETVVESSAAKEIVECLDSLSDELDLQPLWDALSSCLRDLAHTPDHHAVLVLQVTSFCHNHNISYCL
jgi:E3 ubiquitin-protein ligase HUWE1